jgi:hypothetical protein
MGCGEIYHNATNLDVRIRGGASLREASLRRVGLKRDELGFAADGLKQDGGPGLPAM